MSAWNSPFEGLAMPTTFASVSEDVSSGRRSRAVQFWSGIGLTLVSAASLMISFVLKASPDQATEELAKYFFGGGLGGLYIGLRTTGNSLH